MVEHDRADASEVQPRESRSHERFGQIVPDLHGCQVDRNAPDIETCGVNIFELRADHESILETTVDAIFGRRYFSNEVVWCYKENDVATRHFQSKYDCSLFYSVSDNYTVNFQTGEITEAQRKRFANMKGKIRE